MLVEDVLCLPSFDEATVIAGKGGLAHEVSGAMILEAADIENWGKRGQLIVSSFYAIENLSNAEMARFFHTMSSIGIAALAFKPERLMSKAPKTVLDLCNDFDIPLIQLSPSVKYESILIDVMGHILDSKLTLLNRFYEFHKRMMVLALEQPSVSHILNTLKNALHVDATFLDTERDRRVATDPGKSSFDGYSFSRREPSSYQTCTVFDMHLFYEADRDNGRHQSLAKQALAVRIPSSDNIDYYLLIHNEGAELTPLDNITIENIVSLLQMEILKQNAIKQKLFFQNNNAVHDLLLNRYGSHDKVDAALTSLGIDQHPLYETLLIKVDLDNPNDFDRQGEIHRAIQRKLRTLYPGIVYYESSDRMVLLHNYRSVRTGFDLKTIGDALSELRASSALPLFSFFAVLSSSTKDRYSIPTLNNEVIGTYRLFQGSKYRNRCMSFNELGIFKLLLMADSPAQVESYIDPRLRDLSSSQPDLFRTLVKLCENSLDYAKTAEELYIHPKTVRYRINRIQETTGIDAKNPDDYLQILLSDRILTLTDISKDESQPGL